MNITLPRVLPVAFALFFFTGCQSAVEGGIREWQTGGRPEDPHAYASADGGAMGAMDAGMAPTTGEEPTAEPTTTTQGGAGVLTAGGIDDHLNPQVFEVFLDHAAQYAQTGPDLTRHAQIQVQNAAGEGIMSALVEVKSQRGERLLEMRTASDGRALFLPAFDGFPSGDSFEVVASLGNAQARGMFTLDGSSWKLQLDGVSAEQSKELDLAFIVDATGSMGDEIEFLKAEVAHIAAKVQSQFSGVDIRFGLIVYRDESDDYTTRGYGFADLQSFQSFLAQQSADGGGDYPEAMHTALSEAHSKLPWRKGHVVRMAFLLADAPPHDDKVGETFEAIDALRRASIRLYPVASSGVADLAEYVMRASAFLTQSRYLFLTDDSGVGNPHQEPHQPTAEEAQPCYVVQKLEHVMIRAIASELAGKLLEPDPATVLRTVGNPVNGVCQP